MSDTLWASRPLPSLERPDRAVWRGAPATLAELRAMRMQLRVAMSHGGRPAAATDDDVERLLLAFEELVSNGLRHARGPVEAAVTTTTAGWLLEVSDGAGDSAPVPAVGRDAALGGLGLYLVAQLCGSHGWSAQDDGRKIVWARLDFTGDARATPAAPSVRREAPSPARPSVLTARGAGWRGAAGWRAARRPAG